MKLARAGRLLYPLNATWARHFAKRNLVSLGSRSARLRASFGSIPLNEMIEQHDLSDLPLSLLVGPDAALVTPMIAIHAGRISEWLLLRDYEGESRGRNVLFLFADSPVPALIAKVRRMSSTTPPLETEAMMLRAVHSRVGDIVARTIPRTIDLLQTSDAEILLLSVLPGRPLALAMQRTLRPSSAFASHLAAAGSWLGRFHQATRNDRGEVAVHGDFWPRNVLYDGNELTGVVDWEGGSSHGEPETDLFTLPLLFATDTASWGKEDLTGRYRRAFLEDSALSRAIRRYLHAYCETSSVPFGELRAMFERFVAASEEKRGKEGKGWHTHYPWDELLRMLDSSNRSVFSG